MAWGWAVEQEGAILIETVSPTEVGAMVNWLYVHARAPVLHGTSDEAVRRAFDHEARLVGAFLARVIVEVAGAGDD